MNRFVRSRSYAAVAALAACVAALSACSSSGGKSAGSTSSPAGGGGSSSTATAGTTATKSAIVIGNVSAESGPEEASLGPQQNGLDAWVKYTNDNGGIQGHPIKLVTADSKSDPTVEATSFQTLAKSQHPVAFVGVGAFALASAVPFLSSSGIPVIGGNSDDAIWNQNGILYSQGTSHVAMLFGSAASAGSANKFGHVYCAESPACSQNDQLLFQIGLGKVAGTDPVFSQKVTLTQPDYTATCVAAKSAGATILQADLTTARTEVLAQNCQRQG